MKKTVTVACIQKMECRARHSRGYGTDGRINTKPTDAYQIGLIEENLHSTKSN